MVEEDRGQGVVDVEVHMVDREAHIVEEAKEALVAEEGSKEQLIITSSSRQGLAEVEEAEEEDLQPIIRTSLGIRTTRLSKVLQTRLSPLVLTAVLKTVLRATMEVKAEGKLMC